MRTSATGTEGFALIEILVVVAIVGIVTAVAAANLFPSNEQLARRDAGDVALAIERARDAAWFGGLPTSITFEDGRIRAWRYGGDAWREDAQHTQALPGELRVTGLALDGQPVAPRERLVFLADGLATPFRVSLESRGFAWAIDSDAAGSVRLAGP